MRLRKDLNKSESSNQIIQNNLPEYKKSLLGNERAISPVFPDCSLNNSFILGQSFQKGGIPSQQKRIAIIPV